MRTLILLFVFMLLLPSGVAAQDEGVILKEPYPDGIFMSFEDFQILRLVPKTAVTTTVPTHYLDFFSRVLFEKELIITTEYGERRVPSASVWGFLQNNVLYLNYRGEFYRVPVFGTFSYFVATVVVSSPGFYDPRFGTTISGGTTREIREFMMDIVEGRVKELSHENVRQVFSRDPALWAEYSKLSRRKQKDQLYRFIRRFNETHPVFVYPG
jgi:hypothetical protein